jgi:hypothetical protein
VRLEWLDLSAHDGGALVDAEHARDVGTVHIGVHHTYTQTGLSESHRQVRRYRGLSDSALSRRDRQNLSEIGLLDRLLRGRHLLSGGSGWWTVGRLRRACWVGNVDLDLVPPDALHCGYCRSRRTNKGGWILR